MAGTVTVARFDDGAPEGSVAFLVERVWPAEVDRATSPVTWVRRAAPSTELTEWFAGDVCGRWDEFRERYREELNFAPEDSGPMLAALPNGDILLLTTSPDAEHNSSVVMAEWLTDQFRDW
nr:DUF488 family protein [Micromonospora sp. DSM 115978]